MTKLFQLRNPRRSIIRGRVIIHKRVEIKTFAVACLSSAPNILAIITILTIAGIADCIIRTEITSGSILTGRIKLTAIKNDNKIAGTSNSRVKESRYAILLLNNALTLVK
jgi:hypothetical protein